MGDFDFEKEKQKLDETFESIDKTLASLEKKSYDGTRDILKYFDRINDKLFTFNNIMIAGFFAMGKMKNNVPIEFISVPIANLGILIFIEYKMMEKSRMEANILDNINLTKHKTNITNTTEWSMFAIFTTTTITLFFLYNLFIR